MSRPMQNLADWLYADAAMSDIFTVQTSIQLWVDIEIALVRVQGSLDIVPKAVAEQIAVKLDDFEIDLSKLQASTRTVGYPILPLVRQLDEHVPAHVRGHLHFGATTQDIMDTALAIQLVRACDLLDVRVEQFGDALAAHVDRHRRTAMAGRTHAQQAVPTTWGAKCATYLAELTRHRQRLLDCRGRVGVVSLFGAAGTGASLGASPRAVRSGLADELGLATIDVPWHVTRDSVTELLSVAAMVASTCARFAREIVDLSRTELAEVHEPVGHHRGASSTMPQKRNPITSEACIGMAVAATTIVPAALRAMEAGHERAAGEWQIEWKIVPEGLVASSSALVLAGELAANLSIDRQRMTDNMSLDDGLLMSETYMIALAPQVGRERAHDIVYDAAARVRSNGGTLAAELRSVLPDHEAITAHWPIALTANLGEVEMVCDTALGGWSSSRKEADNER